MNVDLLRQIQAQIAEEPDSFIMADWYVRSEDVEEEEEWALDADHDLAPACGTAACIAGWAWALHFRDEHGNLPEQALDLYPIFSDTSRLMDLIFPGYIHHFKSWEPPPLFYTNLWPADLRRQWDEALEIPEHLESRRARAKVACTLIDRLIDEGPWWGHTKPEAT